MEATLPRSSRNRYDNNLKNECDMMVGVKDVVSKSAGVYSSFARKALKQGARQQFRVDGTLALVALALTLRFLSGCHSASTAATQTQGASQSHIPPEAPVRHPFMGPHPPGAIDAFTRNLPKHAERCGNHIIGTPRPQNFHVGLVNICAKSAHPSTSHPSPTP